MEPEPVAGAPPLASTGGEASTGAAAAPRSDTAGAPAAREPAGAGTATAAAAVPAVTPTTQAPTQLEPEYETPPAAFEASEAAAEEKDQGPLVADEEELCAHAALPAPARRPLPPAVRGVLAEIALRGALRHPWAATLPALHAALDEALDAVGGAEAEAAGGAAAGPRPPVLECAPAPAAARARLHALLDAAPAPPFTAQRLCEVLLAPTPQHPALDRLALALERLLLVTSAGPAAAPPAAQPPRPPLAALGPVNADPPSPYMLGNDGRPAPRPEPVRVAPLVGVGMDDAVVEYYAVLDADAAGNAPVEGPAGDVLEPAGAAAAAAAAAAAPPADVAVEGVAAGAEAAAAGPAEDPGGWVGGGEAASEAVAMEAAPAEAAPGEAAPMQVEDGGDTEPLEQPAP
jgi:hypothetical protein